MKVPYGDRSNEVIEPYLTDQWYVDAKTLAQPALEAVREGKTTFIPENWRNVISSGLRTSSLGASRASSGGAIKSRLGMGRTRARLSSRYDEKEDALSGSCAD